MAENSTKIILTAEDRTAPALASVTRGLGGMQAEAVRAAGSLAAIGFTAAGAAAVGFVRSVANVADEFQKLSQRVGIGARELAGWQLAADLSGASVESITKGVKGLATYIAQYGDKLKALGIDTSDANVAFMQLADLFAAMPDGMEKTAVATQLFGKAGLDLIPLLNEGSDGIRELRARADGYGATLERIGPDAEKFNDELEVMVFNAKAAGANIAAYFIPGLAGLSTWLNDITAGGARARQALEFFGEKVPGWGDAMRRSGILDPRSQGYSGPKNALGLPATPAEIAGMGATAGRTAEQQAAIARAQSLLTTGGSGGGKSAKAAKATRVFDPDADFDQKFAEMQRKYLIAGQDAAEREAEALDRKRQAMEDMAERRMEEQRLAMDGEEAIREHMERTTRAVEKQNATARELGLTFSSAFEDAIVGGKGLQQVVQGLVQDVSRIFVRKTLTEPLGNALGDMFSGFDFGRLFGGGSSTPTPSAWDFGPFSPDKFASGGDHAGGYRIVGERGPELEATGPSRIFNASQTRDILSGGGSSGAIKIEVINPPGMPAEVAAVQPSIDVDGQVIKIVMREMSHGGRIARHMEGRYRLNPAAGVVR